MYIKSIVLDGFKSYAQRTEIQGFDPLFNAITGLNGSGKSNILDSICFLLGITNLSHVRATNLQDLIYKSGQTGITKATVSITFDNRNKSQSPVGLEDCNEITITRQIMLGGKNKYLINGTIVPNKRIHDVFCSVHLNVNNPHFLVMQGKITKVLNMKPQDFLAMIEEAAGTKVYDHKRIQHVKTMEKKDAKLQEFQETFTHEIQPRLEMYRQQRTQYFEFQRIEREVERLRQYCAALVYCNTVKLVNEKEKDVIIIENQIAMFKTKVKEDKAMIKEIEEEVNEKMEQHKTSSDNKLEEIKAELTEKQKLAAGINATEKTAKDRIKNEEENVKKLETVLKADVAALTTKQEELAKFHGLFDSMKAAEDADKEALAICEKKYEAICAGMEVNDEGEAQTLKDQLISAKEQAKKAATDLKVDNLNLSKCRDQLKMKRANLTGASADYNKEKTALENVNSEITTIQKSLNKLNYSENRMGELEKQRHTFSTAINDHMDNIENFYASKPYLRFNYTDPEPGFNRGTVFGIVASLIKVKDRAYSVAIETAAGGRLYNVVVDKDTTCKKLLQRGNLQNRTTFIPLNQIQADRMKPQTVNFARKLVGEDNLIAALDVLEYSPQVKSAIEYIFGNIFIAKNISIAKQISYHDSIRKTCVTLDGDTTSPSGTLSGGARQKTTPVLLLLDDVLKEQNETKRIQKELNELEKEYRTMLTLQERYTTFKNRLDILTHESEMLKNRLKQDTFSKQQEEIKQLETSIIKLEENIKQNNHIQSECAKKIKNLESKMTNSKDHLEKQQKEIEAELVRLRKKAEQSQKKYGQREQDQKVLDMEVVELTNTIKTAQENIEAAQNTIKTLKEEHQKALIESEKLREIVAEVKERMQHEKSVFAEQNKEIQKIIKSKDEKVNEIMKIELELKTLAINLNTAQNEHKVIKIELKNVGKDIKDIDNKYIEEAKNLSEAEGRKMEKKLSEGKLKLSELKTKVNPKAQIMYEHEEKAYATIQKKINQINIDKELLKKSIKSLDSQKEEAIKIAFEQVTKDLGSILSTLLPGANAKLGIPKGHSILTGVEIKVSLGGVWKESLGELSGGQRSLIALSFILAMLLFNPAPLYILDEVDAALDLSHTQNIGTMLKQHFQQSQFIIVSLKDGMFNNANVLFKTQFIDGKSTISRSANVR
nr:structural maintenance of chromosomes protein 2 [Onthophagus taurus]